MPSPAADPPLFRYALDHWRADDDADRYPVFVLYRGRLSAEEEAAVNALAKAGGRRGLVNLTVRAIDLNDFKQGFGPPAVREGAVPNVSVLDPQGRLAWAGPLTAGGVNALLDSPARRELARRLLRGEAAVWVLLTGGDREADGAAADRLEKELRRLEGAFHLPEPDADEATPPIPRIVFSTLPVDRRDPAEAAFLDLLLHGRHDAAAAKGPLVFPVFGRGRMLDGLSGADLQGDGVEKAARYLCGPCSVPEKRRNPGVDLLMAADWDAAVENRPAVELPTPVVAPFAAKTVAGSTPGAPLWAATWKPPLWAAAAAVLAVAALYVWRRSSPRHK